MSISAYLIAARVLDLEEPKRFALKSLDRILSEAWEPQRGLLHVVATPIQSRQTRCRRNARRLRAARNACIEAYESTSVLAYFNFAQKIVEVMVAKVYDPTSGGFFDAENAEELGALAARRKPFQDSPTPAGDPAAAIALLACTPIPTMQH